MEHSEEQRSTDCIAASGCNCLVLASVTPRHPVSPRPRNAERRQEVASTATLAILVGDDSRWRLGVGEAMLSPRRALMCQLVGARSSIIPARVGVPDFPHPIGSCTHRVLWMCIMHSRLPDPDGDVQLWVLGWPAPAGNRPPPRGIRKRRAQRHCPRCAPMPAQIIREHACAVRVLPHPPHPRRADLDGAPERGMPAPPQGTDRGMWHCTTPVPCFDAALLFVALCRLLILRNA